MNIVTAKDIKPDLAKKVYGYLEARPDGYSITIEGYSYLYELCTGDPAPLRTVRYWCERGLLGEDAAIKGVRGWYIHKNEAIKLLHKFFPHERDEALKQAYDLQMQMFKG